MVRGLFEGKARDERGTFKAKYADRSGLDGVVETTPDTGTSLNRDFGEDPGFGGRLSKAVGWGRRALYVGLKRACKTSTRPHKPVVVDARAQRPSDNPVLGLAGRCRKKRIRSSNGAVRSHHPVTRFRAHDPWPANEQACAYMALGSAHGEGGKGPRPTFRGCRGPGLSSTRDGGRVMSTPTHAKTRPVLRDRARSQQSD